MHHHQRGGGAEFDREVAVGHRVERVVAHAVEAEFLGDHHAVDRERGAGERGAAERQAVDALAAVGEPLRIAREHFEIRHQVVRVRHRLRDLQVRETRHDGVGVLVGEFDQRELRRLDQTGDLVDRRAQIQPHIGRDLVVARARGVQPLAGIADQRGEPPFDVGVHVFEVGRPFEFAGTDFIADLGEALLDGGEVAGAEDFDRVQHARVRNRARDIEFGEPLVEADRRGETLDEFAHRFVEPSRPRRRLVHRFFLRHVSALFTIGFPWQV